ncbi:extracellular solute-binding protein [Paenibacillaceae bacterium WGS1546]|uniref:extracellular solute-binding protein n=1 Tax=Cohnella sp. WGS1546 TaxID=3366810 RepID=UPI00372CF303
MGKKAWVALLAAVVLTISACSDNTPGKPEEKTPSPAPTETATVADPFGRYEETVPISLGLCIDPSDKTLPPEDTPEDNIFTRHAEELLNVDITLHWTVPCTDEPQKISLAIAGGDLPDAMIVNYNFMKQMADAGQLEDMTEIYEQYASPKVKSIIDSTNGFAIQAATIDGRLMSIPGSSSGADGVHLMWIRQDWLDKLKLQPPTTIDELGEVAKAFVEQDPDGNSQHDTFAISGPQADGKLNANFLVSHNNLYGFDPIFSAYNAYPGYWLEDEDGKAVYGSLLPETKEALAKLREWYDAGYIDPETGFRKDAMEPIIAGKSGIYFSPWWMGFRPTPQAVQHNPEANWQAYALPLDKNGEFSPHGNSPTTRYMVVRKGYKHPEAAMKVLNVTIEDGDRMANESGVSVGFLPLKLVLVPYDKYEGGIHLLQEVLSGNQSPDVLDADKQPYDPNLRSQYEQVLETKKEPYLDTHISHWDTSSPYFGMAYSWLVGTKPLLEPMNKVFSLTYGQTKSMEGKWANLEKLEKETFMRIIVGAAPLDAFDQFVIDWKKQGGDEITEEVQAAR